MRMRREVFFLDVTVLQSLLSPLRNLHLSVRHDPEKLKLSTSVGQYSELGEDQVNPSRAVIDGDRSHLPQVAGLGACTLNHVPV